MARFVAAFWFQFLVWLRASSRPPSADHDRHMERHGRFLCKSGQLERRLSRRAFPSLDLPRQPVFWAAAVDRTTCALTGQETISK